MCERIKTIKQYYSTLEYEMNKKEALKKISTLNGKLKFKDNDDFLDRLSQTVSIIEKNVSVFESACDHVDIVAIILDFLHAISVKLMFNSNDSCSVDEINIIYIMSVVCEEHEIPSFLRAALINNSRLAGEDDNYRKLISNYVFEMIVLEDSDLYALISYLRITPFFLLKIKKIFIQESINQKFLWLIEKYFKATCSNLPISIFRTKKELLTLPSHFENLHMVSIWSEDIAAAKVLATRLLHRDITFINAHLEFCSDINFTKKWIKSSFDISQYVLLWDHKIGDKINPNEYTGSIYNLFYNGFWQKPVKDKYWIHNGNTYAQATNEDILRCLRSAEEAFKNWSICPIVSRKKILENLASTLECNGKFLLANTILRCIKYESITSNFNNLLKCRDERLEIIDFRGPKGIITIFQNDEVTLFSYLTLSLMTGNCVIMLCNKNSCTVASYFNMFSTAEVPSGVINLLLNKDLCEFFPGVQYEQPDFTERCTSLNYIILPLK